MKVLVEKLESLLDLGGMKKDIAFLVISALALIASLTGVLSELPFDPPGAPSCSAASPSFWKL